MRDAIDIKDLKDLRHGEGQAPRPTVKGAIKHGEGQALALRCGGAIFSVSP